MCIRDRERVIRKERLEPGKILLVDTVKGELIEDSEDVYKRQPLFLPKVNRGMK